MSYDEALVGVISLGFAAAALAIAVGPWTGPYRLPSMMAVSRRFGKLAARGVWLAIAIAALTAGVSILSGLRPGYALPSSETQLNR